MHPQPADRVVHPERRQRVSPLELSFAAGACVRFNALLDGRVRPEGVTLRHSHVTPSELFWRQLAFQDFDISEMSLSSLLIAASHGKRDWWALPVFPWREFFHNWIMVRDGSGIERPEDLAGKRVGVPEYQQTAAVWSRGILKDEFGVDAADVEWFMERTRSLSHGGATAFTPPAGVTIRQIPPDDSMNAMLERGALDAVLLFITERTMADRSFRSERTRGTGIHPLFGDPLAEAARFHQRTGVLPLNHCVVVRRSLVDAHPWLPLNLFRAFDASREAAFQESRQYVRLEEQLGRVTRPGGNGADAGGSGRGGTGPGEADVFPYGFSANEKALRTLVRFQVDQGLVEEEARLEDVFAPSCLGL